CPGAWRMGQGHAGAFGLVGTRTRRITHVDCLLRHALHAIERCPQAQAATSPHFEDLQCADDSIASMGAIQAEQVPRGLATQHTLMLQQGLVYMTVADFGANELDATRR